jgi:hypothetical protein
VTTTASCRFAGGGLCGPKDGSVAVFKKALGPYPTEAAARSALKEDYEIGRRSAPTGTVAIHAKLAYDDYSGKAGERLDA